MKKLIVALAAAAITMGVTTTSVSAQEYEVVKGDTLWDIANDYNTDVDELMNGNELDDSIIYPEQILNIDNGGQEKQIEDNQSDENVDKASKESDHNGDSQGETVSVEATAYTASCEGCTGVTATGVDLDANPNEKVIAVDPDVIPLGSEVYVEGYGYATAEDTGSDIKGDRIDLFIPSEDEALDYGRQPTDVTIID